MRVSSKTHLGLIRENNEDALLVASPYLFAVADGMGGSNAGEVASHDALNIFRAVLEKQLENGQSVSYAFRKAVSEANENIYNLSNEQLKYKGMGTTLTALYIDKYKFAHVVQVGDSRLYRFRNGKLTLITEDQTLVGEMVKAGKITRMEAKLHPHKNLLSQAIGVSKIIQAELSRFEIKEKDVLLLCSDGLSNMLSEEEIADGLSLGEPKKCVEQLLEQALKNGGRDNISLIVIDEFGKEDSDGANN